MAAALKPASVTFTAVAALATTIGIGAILLSPHLRTCAAAAEGVIACVQGAVQDATASNPGVELGQFDASAIETPPVVAVPVDIVPAPALDVSRNERTGAASTSPAPAIELPSMTASQEATAPQAISMPSALTLGESAPELDATTVAAIPPAPPTFSLAPDTPLGEMSAAASSAIPPMPAELQPSTSAEATAVLTDDAPSPLPSNSDATAKSPAEPAAPPSPPVVPKRNSASISTLRTINSPSVTTLSGPGETDGTIVMPKAPKGTSGHFTRLSRPGAGPSSITSLD